MTPADPGEIVLGRSPGNPELKEFFAKGSDQFDVTVSVAVIASSRKRRAAAPGQGVQLKTVP